MKVANNIIRLQMQQNDQGFAEQSLSTLVDFNYSPHSITNKAYHSKSLHLSAIINPKHSYLTNSPYINQQLRQNWIAETIKKIDHIVYNNFNKNLVNYTEKSITFDSSFESGNIDLVSKRRHNQYQLYMRPDTNTQNHFQWFFFRVTVKNNDQPKKVTFFIKNFIKAGMMYSQGLRPYYSSLMDEAYKQIDNPVQFYLDQTSQHYVLKFSFVFSEKSSEIFFTSQPPYTYKYLCSFIKSLECKKLSLGLSVLGQTVPYLIFPQRQRCKAVGIVLARQHPGQSVGSWVMHGFIKQIQENKQLNNSICWVVIPMLNVDGVILGNNRTGVLGHDFNRNWNIQEKGNPKQTYKREQMFPQISAVLKLIRKLRKEYRGKIRMFIDLHGHSSQPNVFSYGPIYDSHSENFWISRLFPNILAKKNQYFNTEQCSYTIEQNKKNTLRSVISSSVGIPYVYTVQSSFGVLKGKKAIADDYVQVGRDVAFAANQFLTLTSSKSNKNCVLLEKSISQIKQKYQKQIKNPGKQFDSGSQASDQTPIRTKFEQKIAGMLMRDTESTKMKQKRAYVHSQKQKDPLDKPLNFKIQRSFDGRIETECSITIPRKQIRNNSCFKTELCLKKDDKTTARYITNPQNNYRSLEGQRCKLPVLQNLRRPGYRKKQRIFSLVSSSPQKFDFKQIQGKLYDIRNTKIGKKVLIMNSYLS